MRLVVFDSGLGGLSVVGPIRSLLPGAAITYVADNAVFPYGDLDPERLVRRVVALMTEVVAAGRPAAVVIACNTASTLVLPPLRAHLDVPVVGTVPAVKPAAERSRSRLVSVLATPATVRRDYTRDLIAEHGRDCRFTLVGAPRLAGQVERILAGEAVGDDDLRAEVAGCFVEDEGRRTDIVVLACTHYPLVLDRLSALAPWPVEFIDPAPAIARRVVAVTDGALTDGHGGPDRFLATGPLPPETLLARFGFGAADRVELAETAA